MVDAAPNLSDLDQVELRTERGHLVMQIGMNLTLFIPDPHEPTRREAVVDVLSSYVRLAPGQLDHWQPSGGARTIPIRVDWIDHYRGSARSALPTKSFGVRAYSYGSGERSNHSPMLHFVGAYLRPMRSPPELGFLDVNFPASTIDRLGAEAVVRSVVDWCGKVRPAHGSAGLAMIFAENDGGWTGNDLRAAGFINRFPGLDFPGSMNWTVAAGELQATTIRAINWLTVLADPLVEAAGGRHALQHDLSPECTLHPYDGGLVIQAGPHPEPGDRNRNLIPIAYRKVWKRLKPLVFQDYGVVPPFESPEPLDSREQFMAWLNRFD